MRNMSDIEMRSHTQLTPDFERRWHTLNPHHTDQNNPPITPDD